jgi:hypothetical protein
LVKIICERLEKLKSICLKKVPCINDRLSQVLHATDETSAMKRKSMHDYMAEVKTYDSDKDEESDHGEGNVNFEKAMTKLKKRAEKKGEVEASVSESSGGESD